MYPILISCAIKPPRRLKATKLIDPHIRLAATKSAIFYWVALGAKEIVIVDSTNTSPLSNDDIEIVEKCGVKVEILLFQQNDEEIEVYGKGYGEGYIIKHAIEYSKILSTHEYFYKITGKCFCRNFMDLDSLINQNKIKSIFWRLFDRHFNGGDLRLIDTRFFFTSKSFFMDYMFPVYIQAKDFSIERLIVTVLAEKLAAVYVKRPQISGFSGGFGAIYSENDLGYLEHSFPALADR